MEHLFGGQFIACGIMSYELPVGDSVTNVPSAKTCIMCLEVLRTAPEEVV